MISCLIIVQLTAFTEFDHTAFDAASQSQAERLAAMHAGQLASRHHPDGNARFGFKCGEGEWVAVGLTWDDVFGSQRVASRATAG